jgi:tRNA pseudouridine(55) synthase
MTKKVGVFSQVYPAYSSRTVNSRQLHELARAGGLPGEDEMPKKTVTIYSIHILEDRTIRAGDLKKQILQKIDSVKGDFRQEVIKKNWSHVLNDHGVSFPIITIRVKCSSGTYMRSLAHELGTSMGCGAFALSIRRIAIFDLSGTPL